MGLNYHRRLHLKLQQDSFLGKSNPGIRALYDFIGRLRFRTRDPFLPIHRQTHTIYIHVPKTGGCTVKRIVYDLSSREAGGHKPAWEYRLASPQQFDNSFVFATVRHPLSRLRSAFCYLKSGAFNANSRKWGEEHLANFTDFRTFAFRLAENKKLRREIMSFRHFLPQYYFLCDAHGKCLINQIIRTETFSEDLSALCERLNLPFCERRDNARIGGYADLPRDPDLERISFELYRNDYALLGYGIREPVAPSGTATGVAACADR